jgi:polyisoprenoid-binding protein YceI
MKKAFFLAAVAAFALNVQAVEYSLLVPEKSAVVFVSKQMNVPTEGRFKAFRSKVSFDPTAAAKASIEFEIDPASIDLGDKDANAEAKGKDWFDVKAHPTARFVSSSVKSLGNNRFEIAGKMTVKGITRDLIAPVSFRQDGSLGIFEGSLTLKRADYGIGEGIWATFETVENNVLVKFTLAALPAKK